MAWWSRVPTLRRMAEPSVRTITDDELGAYINVVRTAFVEGPASDEEIEARRPHTDLARALGAYDEDGRMCGAARAFGTQLTVPGRQHPAVRRGHQRRRTPHPHPPWPPHAG